MIVQCHINISTTSTTGSSTSSSDGSTSFIGNLRQGRHCTCTHPHSYIYIARGVSDKEGISLLLEFFVLAVNF